MSLSCYKYQLPFREPFSTSKKTFNTREGLLIKYSDNKVSCYGEAAPLAGFSRESLDEVIDSYNNSENSFKRLLQFEKPVESLYQYYKEHNIPRSLQFGLDTIAIQIEAHEKNKPIQKCLFDEYTDKVPVNALIVLNSENPEEKVRQFLDKGFKTIKCKVGMDFESELNVLKHIRANFPDLTIRLDANQSWTLKEALQHCKELERLDIEYCEEPLKHITPENYEALHLHTSVPLALDESVCNVEYWPNLLPFTSFLILKPMFLGSFTTISETKRLANTHDNNTVFTTSLESGIGRTITAIMASGLGTSSAAHGLSTGKLLANDLITDQSSISKGYYHLKKQQNIPVDPQQIDKFCIKL